MGKRPPLETFCWLPGHGTDLDTFGRMFNSETLPVLFFLGTWKAERPRISFFCIWVFSKPEKSKPTENFVELFLFSRKSHYPIFLAW